MMKTTLKDIRKMVEYSHFIDLNEIDEEQFEKVTQYYDDIAYAYGIYGITGRVIFSYYDNRLYAITVRNSRFFMLH